MYSLASNSLLALPIHCIVSHTKFAQVLIGIALKFRRGELLLVTNVFRIYMWIEGSYPFVPKHNNNCDGPLEVSGQIQSGPIGLSRYATIKMRHKHCDFWKKNLFSLKLAENTIEINGESFRSYPHHTPYLLPSLISLVPLSLPLLSPFKQWIKSQLYPSCGTVSEVHLLYL